MTADFQLIRKGDVNIHQLLDAVDRMLNHASSAKKLPSVTQTEDIAESLPVILVIEDNPDNMITIKAMLGDGFEVIEAADGYTGVNQAITYTPDLILMDIALPGMNGIEVLNKIRKDEKLRQIPAYRCFCECNER